MGNLGGERHSTSRVHLISVGIHFEVFWEKIIARWVDREGKRDITKKSINHQSCSFQRSNQHKGTRKCKYLQRGRYNLFLIIMYFILFYFILYYFISLFFYLFIYLFILPEIDPGKKSPPPSPTGVSPFTASFACCDLPVDSRDIFYRINYGGSENSP